MRLKKQIKIRANKFRNVVIKIMLNNCYKKQQKWASKNIINADINEKSTPMYSNYQDTDTNKTVINRELNFVIENSLQQIPFYQKPHNAFIPM